MNHVATNRRVSQVLEKEVVSAISAMGKQAKILGC